MIRSMCGALFTMDKKSLPVTRTRQGFYTLYVYEDFKDQIEFRLIKRNAFFTSSFFFFTII